MALRVIGAGLPRTGTKSLQQALQRLVGGPCYHMHEVFAHLEHVPVWRAALRGELPDWGRFFRDYVSTVDWPASAFWKEIAEANPQAVVILSVRRDPETWWSSVDETVLSAARHDLGPELTEWQLMFRELLADRWGLREPWRDGTAAMEAYEQHVAEVRASAPAERLLEWRPGDGWEPICAALGVAVPEEAFPHLNTREEWARG